MPFLLNTTFLRVLLPALLLLSGCAGNRAPQPLLPLAPPKAERPKNIILLIGDGMALPQVSAGIYWQGVGRSVFERFPIVGFHQSHSYDDLVTDSAAGATAFACGHKTTNGAIGVVPPNNDACGTILEDLDRDGVATGMVVTCSATHATPASFIAHQDMRAFTEEIARDFLHTNLDCFIGGGQSAFDDRPDRQNLLDSLRARGYVVRRGPGFGRLPLDGSAPFMLFTADREPTTASAGRNYLAEATLVACQFLEKRGGDRGFFLMVEGSQIDWALHANDANWLRAEMADFDKTVSQALAYAEQNGETLVIVTGDHECGGLSLNEGRNKRSFVPTFSARLHTAALVPVYAYGPRAELFSGMYDNTEIYYKMQQARNSSLRSE